jgi:hypothetical protein
MSWNDEEECRGTTRKRATDRKFRITEFGFKSHVHPKGAMWLNLPSSSSPSIIKAFRLL